MNRNLVAGIGALLLPLGAATLPACGGATSGPADMTLGGFEGQYVVKSMKLPADRYQLAFDLDGDTRTENALGTIIALLLTQNLNAQGAVDNSLIGGQVVTLIGVPPPDANRPPGEQSDVLFYNGTPMPQDCPMGDAGTCTGGPDYSGNGMFRVDGAALTSRFSGQIDGSGAFSSSNPATTKKPVTMELKLSFLTGAPPVVLPTNGAHIQFVGDPGGLMKGEIHGSVRVTDLRTSVLPAVALSLTDKVMNALPGDTSAMNILAMFDLGGCGTAQKGDKKIDLCELEGAQAIAGALTADIQVFDPPGSSNYAPVPKPKVTDVKNRDSVSLGVGFEAVPARIIL